jgi:predicted porin
MKKTLIALAVLAASGASFAQVTITGEYAYGFQADKTSAGAETSGLGNDTSLVTFTAVEDLGGGLKATAVMNIDGLTRGGVSGGDSSVALGGGFGTVKLGYEKGADYLSSVIGGIASFDSKVFGDRTSNDFVSYTSPSFSGVTFGLSHTENKSSTALGTGSAGNNDQRSNSLSLSYAAGPLAVTGSFTTWDNQGVLNTTATSAFFGTSKDASKSRARLKGSYDFGMFKLGAGVLQTQKNEGSYQEAILAATAPFGALTLGVDYGTSKRENSNTTTGDVSKNGYGLQAAYALSKRTSVIGSYRSWDDAGANRASTTWLVLDHTF